MSRLGRGRPASSLLRGAGISARAGRLAGSGGGSGTLSVAPVLNLIENPTFDGSNSMPGWTTNGFSLVSGATINPGVGAGEFDFTAIDQGVNYAPPGLTTFLAGVRYYAEVKLLSLAAALGTPAPIELVLGSTSDDYAVTQFTLTGSALQTVRVSWVPQADRSAVDHGLAIRVKSVPGTIFKMIDVDDAIIATADGFWSGWRVGGKGALRALTGSGGSTPTLTTGRALGATITSSAGGGGTFTTRKGGLVGLAPSTGGSGTVTKTGAHTNALAGTGGGSGTLTLSASGSLLLLSVGGLFGGGGRVGRSHPTTGIAPRGVGATYSIFARIGTLAGSAGGSSALSARKGADSAATNSAGGSPAFTVAKGGKGALTTTAGGTGSISSARVADTGGLTATFLMGGGGRIGRSHPAVGIMSRGGAVLAATNPEARSGSLASSAGGGASFSARKGGITSTPTPIAAPPPIFVDILTLPGLRSHADGSLTYSYTRSASQVGSINASAGGTGTFTATKKVAGAASHSAGGNPALTVRKGGRSALTGSAGGSFTFAYLTFEARVGALGSSAGGGGTLRGVKKTTYSAAGSTGGSLTYRAAKGTTKAITGSVGGGLTYSYIVGGLAATGTLTGSGGGTGRLVAGKNVLFVSIAGTAGGSGFITHAKGANGVIFARAGGSGTFLRANLAAPDGIARVTPRHRNAGRVSRDELSNRPLLLRR